MSSSGAGKDVEVHVPACCVCRKPFTAEEVFVVKDCTGIACSACNNSNNQKTCESCKKSHNWNSADELRLPRVQGYDYGTFEFKGITEAQLPGSAAKSLARAARYIAAYLDRSRKEAEDKMRGGLKEQIAKLKQEIAKKEKANDLARHEIDEFKAHL